MHPAIERIRHELATKDYLQKLYPHQQQAYLEVAKAYVSGKKSPILQAVTGYGKSQVGRAIVRSSFERLIQDYPTDNRKKILWLGKNDHIISNAHEHLLAVGLPESEVGIIKAYKSSGKSPFEPQKRIQVASIQTLQACWDDWIRRGLLNSDDLRKQGKIGCMDFQFIVIDECHNYCNQSRLYSGITQYYKHVRKLGLTATPYHKAGLDENFDNLIMTLTQRELADMGYQPKWKKYGTECPVDRSALQVGSDGEYTKKAAKEGADAIATKHGDILKTWVKHVGNKFGHIPTILFAESISHSKEYCNYINDANLTVDGKPLRAVHIDGNMKGWEMDRVFEAILTREATILCNCAKFLEGLDLATVAESRGYPKLAFGAVQDLTFVNSINRHKQKVGRARGFIHEGVLTAIYLDHVGASEAHGDPDTIYEWRLDGKPKKASGEKLVKLCPPTDGGCGEFIYRFLTVCPHCKYDGFPKQLEEELESEDLHDKEAELVELQRTNLDYFRFMLAQQVTSGWAIGEFVKYAPTYSEMLQACGIARVDGSQALQRWIEGQRIAKKDYDWLPDDSEMPTYEETLKACVSSDMDCSEALRLWTEGKRVLYRNHWLPEFSTVLEILGTLADLADQKPWKKAKGVKPLHTYKTWLILMRGFKGSAWRPTMDELLEIQKAAKFNNKWAWYESQQLLLNKRGA